MSQVTLQKALNVDQSGCVVFALWNIRRSIFGLCIFFGVSESFISYLLEQYADLDVYSFFKKLFATGGTLALEGSLNGSNAQAASFDEGSKFVSAVHREVRFCAELKSQEEKILQQSHWSQQLGFGSTVIVSGVFFQSLSCLFLDTSNRRQRRCKYLDLTLAGWLTTRSSTITERRAELAGLIGTRRLGHPNSSWVSFIACVAFLIDIFIHSTVKLAICFSVSLQMIMLPWLGYIKLVKAARVRYQAVRSIGVHIRIFY